MQQQLWTHFCARVPSCVDSWHGSVTSYLYFSSQGFFDAVREGVVHDLMWWLSLKADVNCLNIDKYAHQTPLHIAVQRGDPSIVAFLLLVSLDSWLAYVYLYVIYALLQASDPMLIVIYTRPYTHIYVLSSTCSGIYVLIPACIAAWRVRMERTCTQWTTMATPHWILAQK